MSRDNQLKPLRYQKAARSTTQDTFEVFSKNSGNGLIANAGAWQGRTVSTTCMNQQGKVSEPLAQLRSGK